MFHHISRKDDSVFEKRYLRRYPLLLAMRCSNECTVCYTPEELAKKRSQSCPSLPEIGKELPKKIKKRSKSMEEKLDSPHSRIIRKMKMENGKWEMVRKMNVFLGLDPSLILAIQTLIKRSGKNKTGETLTKILKKYLDPQIINPKKLFFWLITRDL